MLRASSRKKIYHPIKKRNTATSWQPHRGVGRSSGFKGDLKKEFTSKAILLAFFAISVGWFLYFFFLSQNFAIKTVNINGLQNIPSTEIQSIVNGLLRQKKALIFSNRNILLFSKKDLQAAISKKYIVENLRIDKELPFTLTINLKEKLARVILRAVTKIRIEEEKNATSERGVVAGEEAAAKPEPACTAGVDCKDIIKPPEPIYTVTTNYFYLDANGIVVAAEAKAKEDELKSLPVVEVSFDDSQTLVKPGDTILNHEQISYIFSIYEAAKNTSAKLEISYILFDPRVPEEFKLATKEGWQVFLSNKIALETQFKKLEMALSERIKDKRKNLQYVDLRIQDRVYYK